DGDGAAPVGGRVGAELPGAALEDVRLLHGCGHGVPRPFVALASPDTARDIAAFGAVAPAVALVVHLVIPPRDGRPQVGPGLAEIGGGGEDPLGRGCARDGEFDPCQPTRPPLRLDLRASSVQSMRSVRLVVSPSWAVARLVAGGSGDDPYCALIPRRRGF